MVAAGLIEAFLAERERRALRLPVVGSARILVYFPLPREPPVWLGPGMCLLALALLALGRRRAGALMLLIVALAGATGFTWAQWRTLSAATPMLTREIGPVLVDGRVADQEPLPTGARIRVLAVLDGPSPPVAPGTHDFRRHAQFQRIGAVGYAAGRTSVVAPATANEIALRAEDPRQEIGARVRCVLNGDAAAIATALLNGERGAISHADNQAMRDSGLAHLLSISGFRIGLVAMIAFGAV